MKGSYVHLLLMALKQNDIYSSVYRYRDRITLQKIEFPTKTSSFMHPVSPSQTAEASYYLQVNMHFCLALRIHIDFILYLYGKGGSYEICCKASLERTTHGQPPFPFLKKMYTYFAALESKLKKTILKPSVLPPLFTLCFPQKSLFSS